MVSLGLYGEIFTRNVLASGVIPQISLIMGPCAGGAVYSPAITDFTVMVDQTSHMFITGPDVIKTVTGEDVEFEELGGARTHNTKSGVAHYMAADEDDAVDYVKALLSYLPQQQPRRRRRSFDATADLDVNDDDLALDTLIPDSANQPYDMHTVIEAVARRRRVPRGAAAVRAEHPHRLRPGRGPVGRRRRQPADAVRRHPRHRRRRRRRRASCVRATPSTSRCSPSSTCPASCPGTDQEWNGIIRRGAKLIYAYAEATVPLVTVITRKAYGGAYDVMGSKHLGRRRQPRLADRADRGHGRAGRGQHPAPQGARRAADDVEARACAALIADYEDTLAQPLPRGRARLRRRGHRAVADPRRRSRGRCARCAPSGENRATQEAREHPAVTGTDEASEPARPVLRIVRGDPTPEELAAVVAVLSARASAAAGATPA